MHNLSRRIAIALQHEERRCQYLTREAKLMLAVQEEITTGTESEMQSCHTRLSVALLFCTEQSVVVIMCCTSHVCFLSWLKAMEAPSPRLDKFFPNASWPEMWRKPMTGVCVCWVCYCDLCFLNAHGQHWIYDCYYFFFSCSLCTTGVVRLHINSWLEVSFCLPHKIHRIGGNYIPPEALERSLKAIRCNSSSSAGLFCFLVHLYWNNWAVDEKRET